MILCAFALTVLGSAFELLHHRVGVVFVTASTIILTLFGVAAAGATSTIPLDVAVDAQGLTFAGARTPWSQVVDSEVESRGKRAVVRLVTRDRVIRLGPTSVSTARANEAAVRAALP